jgi:hypothetical protein
MKTLDVKNAWGGGAVAMRSGARASAQTKPAPAGAGPSEQRAAKRSAAGVSPLTALKKIGMTS